MQLIKLTDIIPPPKMPEKDRLEQIKESIQQEGLLHAITVQLMNGKYQLISGLYRYAAFKELGLEQIPAEIRENLDEFQMEELSLHENLRRKHLPWHEEVELVQQLHDLRQRQHGISIPNKPIGGKKIGWGMRDTAEELGKSLGKTSQDIDLAKMVKQNPSLRNVKDKTTALKLIKQTTKRIVTEQEAVFSGDVDCADEIYLGEASTILTQLPDHIFDFFITDPPWLKFKDEKLTRDEFTLPVFKSLFTKLKYDTMGYIFCGEDDFQFYKSKLPDFGYKVQGHPCIWAKTGQLSRTGVRAWEHGRDLELILVVAKGSPVIASSTQVSSILTRAVVPSRLLIHQNEKPTGLIEDLITFCSYVGSLGVDPFAGSGVFAEACNRKKRHYACIERDPEAYKKILKRLRK